MSFQDFFNKYFIEPIITGTGYNPVNTAVYAMLFILVAYGTFLAFQKLKIKVDKNLISAILPFILFGISIRVFEDAGIVSGFWFVTPGIWILFFPVIFSILFFSYFIQKRTKIPYYKLMAAFGLTLFIPTLFVIQYKNLLGAGYVLLFFTPIVVALKLIKWSLENKILLGIHGFDAIVTFVAVEFFGYRELHFLPNLVIRLTGTAFSFIILKLVVVAGVLILIDKYTDDKEFRNFLKLAIGILGFVPGIRDFLSLIWLV